MTEKKYEDEEEESTHCDPDLSFVFFESFVVK